MEKIKFNYRFLVVGVYMTLTIITACVQNQRFEELNAAVPDKIPVVSDISAIFFDHCDYQGHALGLSEGEYKLSDLKAHGIENNTLSSFKIASGYEIVFFDEVNFSGAFHRQADNVQCLSETGWDDRISSLKVKRITEGNNFR